MLVASRRKRETILVRIPASTEDRELRIVVTDLLPHRVALGFDAPPEVRILRGELSPQPNDSKAA
jgi:sRNA-binding carbon storage regulator CsrA